MAFTGFVKLFYFYNQKMVAAMSSSLREASLKHVSLHITGGLHQGANLSLEKAVYRIGSSTKSDIILRDSSIAQDHAILRVESSFILLEAVADNVKIGDGSVVMPNHGARMTYPCNFSIGDVSFEVSSNQEASTPASPLPKLMMAASVLLLFAVGLLTIPDAYQQIGQAAITPPPVPLHEMTSASKEATTSPRDIAEVQTAIKNEILKANLSPLQVASSDNGIIVSGHILPSEQAAWTSIASWFDQTYGKQALLISQVRADRKPQKPPVALQAIWLGETPYMIASDGKRYYQGTYLNNGWHVEAIHKDRIIFTKSGEQLALTY